ncbi:MAG: tRNA modification GTPase, partial [Lysobacterales bacterium]
TRDAIEESAQINGVPFQVIDTAGILNPRDLIEEEAIKRSQMYMKSADLVLFMIDASRPLEDKDFEILKNIKDQNILVIVNKTDLGNSLDYKELSQHCDKDSIVEISAITKCGIEQLQEKIVHNVLHADSIDVHGALVNNLRHIQSLKECCELLQHGQKSLVEGLSLEFASEDIKVAVNCLDAITGRNVDVDLIDNIFSQFCIGK